MKRDSILFALTTDLISGDICIIRDNYVIHEQFKIIVYNLSLIEEVSWFLW